MEYSGRTTAYAHKRDDWADHKGPHPPSIQQQTVFEAQWTDCPVEVEEEVKRLWRDMEYGNDVYYYSWESEENGPDYPIIDEYLKSKGVEKCLIHWWW